MNPAKGNNWVPASGRVFGSMLCRYSASIPCLFDRLALLKDADVCCLVGFWEARHLVELSSIRGTRLLDVLGV